MTSPQNLNPPSPPPPPAVTKKEASLREFISKMDEYAPIVRISRTLFTLLNPSLTLMERIPDAVTSYYLTKAGLPPTSPQLSRLLALATQKFIADIAADAYQYSRIRNSTSATAPMNPVSV